MNNEQSSPTLGTSVVEAAVRVLEQEFSSHTDNVDWFHIRRERSSIRNVSDEVLIRAITDHPDMPLDILSEIIRQKYLVHKIIQKGKLKLAQLIISKCRKALSFLNPSGQNLLHIIVSERDAEFDEDNKIEFAAFVISKYPRCISEQDSNGKIALHYSSSFYGQSEMVSLLLFHGPKTIANLDKKGNTPMDYAVMKSGDQDIIWAFISHNPGCLMNTNRWGDIPLFSSLKVSDFTITELLVSHCPHSASIRNNNGRLPLSVAVEKEDIELAALLLSYNPDALLESGIDGVLPLHLAAGSGNIEMVKMLVTQCPKSLSATDDGGFIPLHWACDGPELGDDLNSFLQIIQLLFKESIERDIQGGLQSIGGMFDGCYDNVTPYDLLQDKILFELWLGSVDTCGRLPLHYFAAEGLKWVNGLEHVFLSNFKASLVEDPVTGLYSFMLAAMGEKTNLNTIYELLRRNPASLSCGKARN